MVAREVAVGSLTGLGLLTRAVLLHNTREKKWERTRSQVVSLAISCEDFLPRNGKSAVFCRTEALWLEALVLRGSHTCEQG